MIVIIALLFTMIAIFSSYLFSGGNLMIILKAMPFEFIIIGGAALGAFFISNKTVTYKRTLSNITSSIKGSKWHKQDYVDLFCLMETIFKSIKQDSILKLEHHIEDPEQSEIFNQYPKILKDKFALALIIDTLRLMSLYMNDPYQIEEMLEKKMERYENELLTPSKAMQNIADALPALGIVAAVLGVIKTMSSVDQPPKVLGGMIASALVGTFLGVFLSYVIVGPLAIRMRNIVEHNIEFYKTIIDLLVYYSKGNPGAVAIEVARCIVSIEDQPTYLELETSIMEKRETNTTK